MKEIKQIRVFISSPGDLVREREIAVEICDQISQDIGSIKGFVIDPIRWETHTVSARAKRSQVAISKQVGEYDVYLGVMGFYFGSPTGANASGTEEEFEDALRMNSQSGEPEIQFYFSSAKVNLDEVKIDQYALVKKFQEKLKENGVYYRKFEDLTQFQVLIRKGLTAAVFNILDRKAGDLSKISRIETPSYLTLRPYEVLRNLRREFANDPSVSSHFLFLEAIKALGLFSKRLEEVGQKTNRVANAITSATRELERLNSGKSNSNSKLLKSIERMLGMMEDFTYWLSYEIPLMEDNFMKAMTDLQRGAIITKASENIDDSELEGMFNSVDQTKVELGKLATAIVSSGEALPEVAELGDRWESNRRIYRAITKDFEVFLKQAIDTMTATKTSVLEIGEL